VAERRHPLVRALALDPIVQRGLDLEPVGLFEEERRHVGGAGGEVAILLGPVPPGADLLEADGTHDRTIADHRSQHDRRDAVRLEVGTDQLAGPVVGLDVPDGHHAALADLTQQARELEPVGEAGVGIGAGRELELADPLEVAAAALEGPDTDALDDQGAGAGLGDLAHRRRARVQARQAHPRQLEPSALVTRATAVRPGDHP
jgi:hypothetical protein